MDEGICVHFIKGTKVTGANCAAIPFTPLNICQGGIAADKHPFSLFL